MRCALVVSAALVLFVVGSASGRTHYYTFIDDFHSEPSTTDATGEGFFTLNGARTELSYSLELDGLLGLKPNEADRTEPDDVIGIHLHLHVPGTIGPHILNIFGWPGHEDADLAIDYDNQVLSGVFDISDASRDPETGELLPQFFPLTSKVVTDWMDELDDGELMIAVHTNESTFGTMAIHGHISQVLPEPSAVFLAFGSFVFSWIAARRRRRVAGVDRREPPANLGDRRPPLRGGAPPPHAPCARLLLALLICTTCVAPAGAQPAVEGDWSSVANWPVEAIHAAMLPTGKVLFWQTWTESVGLWDPVTEDFAASALPEYNIFCAGHAWLPDGRLLVAGGHIENNVGEPRATIYDPFADSWATNVPDMNAGRWYPSATTLGNGDVLVMSGDDDATHLNLLPQVYETATNTWRSLTAAERELPLYPRTFLMPDGRVVSLANWSNETEFIDPAGAGEWSDYITWTLDPALIDYAPAVMYDAGKVAVFGGGGGDYPSAPDPTPHAELIDLNAEEPTWRYAGGGTTPPGPGSPHRMAQGRRQNDATILADGTVLITGGSSVQGWNDPSGLVSIPEIWDPITEEFTQVDEASASIFRGYHSTALLLPDGRVLVAGGNHGDWPAYVENKNAEIYSPAYLFNGPRPTVTSAPDYVGYGETFFVATPDAADIVDVTFIVPGSVTHSQNWTQRADHLEFTAVSGGLEITVPSNPNEAPPGYYMLFLINDEGVPSMAEWVQTGVAPLLVGDYNNDGKVSAADYTVWRDNLGAPTLTNRDPENYGPVGSDDFESWKENYGAGEGSGSGAGVTGSASAEVPEPTTLGLCALPIFLPLILRRKLRSIPA